MSIRAFKIIKIEREKSPTFNLWHDEKLVEYLEATERGFLAQLNEGGTGIVEFASWELQGALDNAVLAPNTRAALERDIASGDDYIEYDCF